MDSRDWQEALAAVPMALMLIDSDERILAELADHARATFAEIGARVNLSAPAVKRRSRP